MLNVVALLSTTHLYGIFFSKNYQLSISLCFPIFNTCFETLEISNPRSKKWLTNSYESIALN